MQRDLLREFVQLVRFHEPDGTNIGPFIAEHAGELAHLVQSHESELQAAAHEADGPLVDRFRARLDLVLEADRARRDTKPTQLAELAALEIGRTARWFELGAALDVDLVLGDLLADRRRKHVAFVIAQDVTVVVQTASLRQARMLQRIFIDLACFVDERGIHLRWRGGRGQLNFYGKEVTETAKRDAIVVYVARRTQRPALIGDVLAEIGFGL